MGLNEFILGMKNLNLAEIKKSYKEKIKMVDKKFKYSASAWLIGKSYELNDNEFTKSLIKEFPYKI